jgi:sugar fermentation stimulation protein A
MHMIILKLPNDHAFGTLIRRYKRFLADVQLDSGETVVAHCPNPGRMLTCSAPGSRVRLTHLGNGKRKYPYRLDMLHNGQCWVGVNPGIANAIASSAIECGVVFPSLCKSQWQSEVPHAQGSRIDFLHTSATKHTFVEVKSVSYVANGMGLFPDAVSARATKHVNQLAELCQSGHDAVVLYVLQRGDATEVEAAAHIDPAYATAVDHAKSAGVRVELLPLTLNDLGQFMLTQKPLVAHAMHATIQAP